MSGALVLALIAAVNWTLHGNAQLVEDQDRPAAKIRLVSRYNQDAPGTIGTLAWRDLLAQNAGRVLEVCVRSHATKKGHVFVWLPRAVGGTVTIPTHAGTRYRTRCAPFTVVDRPRSWPGFVQVTNGGVEGRIDFIRNVSIREAS